MTNDQETKMTPTPLDHPSTIQEQSTHTLVLKFASSDERDRYLAKLIAEREAAK